MCRCNYIRYWLKRWAHGERDRSLTHLKRLLSPLTSDNACSVVLRCVHNERDTDVVTITPLLLWEVYEWHRKVPNRTHTQVWYALKHFIRRRMAHYSVAAREAAIEAAHYAFCYTAADKRRLFFHNILHPQEEIWLSVMRWAEYVTWRELIALLLQAPPWLNGTAWNVLLTLDDVIRYMSEAQRQELLQALEGVLLYVDELCLVRSVDKTALWKACETVGFHVRGEAAARILRRVARRCRSALVRQECRWALRRYRF